MRHDFTIFFLMHRRANWGDVRKKKDKEVQIRLVTRLDIDQVFDLIFPDGAGFQVAGGVNRRCLDARKTARMDSNKLSYFYK